MQLPEVPKDVLQAAETISRWAKETNHSAFRIGPVVYATDYRDIRPLFMPHETVPAQEAVAWPRECEALCVAAKDLQKAINELWKAEYPEELDEDQQYMDIDAARESHAEAWKALDTAIHYMRKRMGAPLYTRQQS